MSDSAADNNVDTTVRVRVEQYKSLKRIYRKVDPDAVLFARYVRMRARIKYGKLYPRSAELGNRAVRAALLTTEPFALGKIGSSEAIAIAHIMDLPGAPDLRGAMEEAFRSPGVFPKSEEALSHFTESYMEGVAALDYLGVWFHGYELPLIKSLPTTPTTYRSRILHPYYFGADAWSAVLDRKRVLIISPFTDTIRAQSAKVDQIWPNGCMRIGEFETLKFPLTRAFGDNGYASWRDVVEDFKRRIEASDCDLVLTGCGAAGVPLAAHAKKLGKQGISLGGSLQLLFGVRGRRWDDQSYYKTVINEHWTRPSGDEAPENNLSVEKGGYW